MSNTIFENIKNIDENGNEYWSARDLQDALQYKEFRNFETAIKKAITACEAIDQLNDYIEYLKLKYKK